MMTGSYGDDVPIAAFATSPGWSALTLIRCSGKGAVDLASSVFSAPEKLTQAAGNTILHGWIVTANERIDEVLVSVFRAPKSYTGEDSLDISCHGGGAAGRGVMAALRSAGFRDALPGEFTFRAFMNGKLDLTRSESVMELVSARTDRGRRHAVNRLSGALENEINAIKKILVEVLSGAEIFLDYSEDEIGADPDETAGLLPGQDRAQGALARLQILAASWQRERLYQEGILAVIAGRPNAGKSSLFNLLLREERSIVTEVPGTTRDWIEAWVSMEGIPVRLADTAGLRESVDPVEKIGVERSRDLLDAAELVIYLLDGEAGITAEDLSVIAELKQKPAPHLVLWNKADIAPMPQQLAPAAFIRVSAKTGEGVADLTKAITAAVKARAGVDGAADSQTAAIGSERQKNLVEAAAAAVEEALLLAGREEPLDIIAPLLREAVNALGEITGEVSTADILEEMFSRFCVGK
ncbi:MAG: tRNA uridine-5-carboxymethylaminomethyl(34) synthesis GTPase MnmE [Treponema sp.]|nr:tRNA uridine-5-carboxymethylaminomethyl(34) synthesis GTPase MnmE [Treponema sp.]